jgi:hypothetical protein
VIRLRGEVEYEDGRVVEWEAGSAVLSRWESYAARNGLPFRFEEAPRMLLMQVLAHAALKVDEGFETWRANVAEVRFDADAIAEAVPPTLEGLSAAR